jgi:hypothetical protein
MEYRRATVTDAPALAAMNWQLIRGEAPPEHVLTLAHGVTSAMTTPTGHARAARLCWPGRRP